MAYCPYDVTVPPSNRIYKLPQVLANQIAAGEVVERPASVVKELIENSLDAGATAIKLVIRKGGRLLIRIEDNGDGIHPEDLPLALAQHATSKLIAESDLEGINTLGFRGEALSSIASVSKLKLASRSRGEDHGWLIDVRGGGFSAPQKTPTAMAVGTWVEVSDLFFNMPARCKFLRTDNTEFFHIREAVKRAALSRHDVAFHLWHNDKSVLSYPAHTESAALRIQAIFDKSFCEAAFAVDFERNGVALSGWLGHPDLARNQVDQQYFYLHGRVIRDKQINHAIRFVMQDYLPVGKHPAYVLFLIMDVRQVDVNVHPAKYEVRFRQARDVHDFIVCALKQAFEACHSSMFPTPSAVPDEAPADTDERTDEAPSSVHDTPPTPPPISASVPARTGAEVDRQSYAPPPVHRPPSMTKGRQPELFHAMTDHVLIDERYLIVPSGGKTFLVDLIAGNEQVTLMKLNQDLARQEGVRRRPLLVPLARTVSVEEGDFVAAGMSRFKRFGLVIERIARDKQIVREVPLVLEYADIAQLIDDIVPLIRTDKSDASIVAMMATHANDAGTMKIDSEVARMLLNDVRRAGAEATHKARCAWRELDGELLSHLLKSTR